MTKKLFSNIPGYSRVPLLCVFLAQFVAFYATRPFTVNGYHYDLSLPLDTKLPFLPIFVVPYIAAYFQWTFGFILISRESRTHCYTILGADLMAKTFAFLIFLLLPTSMVRADITGTDIFSRLVGIIYLADTPDNLFPSLHCVESWIVLRGTMPMKAAGKTWKAVMGVTTVLVMLSTVLIKQHLVVDILSAVAVSEISLFTVKYIVKRAKANGKLGL